MRPGVQGLDGRDHDVHVGGRQRLGLSRPHSGYSQTRLLPAFARPHLTPRLDRLLAKLVPVRHPEDAAFRQLAFPNRLDDSLNGDARLARPGGHAHHAAPFAKRAAGAD